MSAIGPFSSEAVDAFFARALDIGAEPLVDLPYDALADRWRAIGLRPGDLVLLSLPTCVSLLHHVFGVIAAGGVPALIAPGTRSARLKELAVSMGGRAIACPVLPTGDVGAVSVEKVGTIEVALLPETGAPAASAGDVVLLTSGTSGSASGCVTSIEAIARNAARHADAIGQKATDTVLVNLPLHFSFAFVAQAIGTLSRGGRLVVAGPPFLPERYARAIAQHEVDVSALAPTQVRTLLHQHVELPDTLRVLGVGGDSLAPDHVADLLRARPRGELYLTYGLTQAGPRVSTLAAHAEPASRFASVGLPLAETKADLEPLADGSERTQLIITSDTVMRRRIGVVEGRSADELRAPGVLATGDLFDRDDAGYLFYRGRLSEWIQRGGEKICIATVRRLATQIPGIVTARTHLVRTDDGEDYDLWLVAGDATPPTPEACRAALAHATRRADLPRTIEVLQPNDPRLGHK